jgi:hypothetical protein
MKIAQKKRISTSEYIRDMLKEAVKRDLKD